MARPGRLRGRPAVVAFGLGLGSVVALGLGRFAYSLLLPPMRADLGWSFAQAGAMNTASSVGYLVGAVAAGPVVARAGGRRPYLAGLATTALALLASGASTDFMVLLVLRLVAGATGAVVFIAGAGLTARLVADLAPGHSAAVLGTFFAGPGLGIVISAVVVPPVLNLGAGGSWRLGWVALGLVSLLAMAGAAPAALRAPEPAAGRGHGLLGWPVRRLAPTLAGYGLFGAGYIGYATFIVAFLGSQGFDARTVSAFWAVLGAATVVAAFAWGPPLGRLRGGRGPAAVLSVVTVGAVLPLVAVGTIGAFASGVLFGAGFCAVVTAVVNLARRSLPPAQLGPAIAVLTIVFGVAQSLGPVLSGMLSDGPGGIRAGLGLSAALLAAATLAVLFQRAIPARTAHTPPGRVEPGPGRVAGDEDLGARE